MKLLIVTQMIDTEDPVLGFFVRWIEEFAKHTDRIEVICLKEGRHSLPANVWVHSLGKERGAASRTTYAFRFLSLAWRLRRDYDAVFVHMNPEYVVLGGFFWRLWGKRVALWYTHKSVNLKLRVAALLSHIVFTASKESFRLRTKKLHVMGHGIDTDFFSPGANVARGHWWLSVGRLMKSKRHDLAIRMAAQESKELHIAGEGPEREHLKVLARELGVRVHFLGGLTHAQLRDEYRKAAYLIHTSETGSLDKVVLEALACGLPVRTNDPALKTLENAAPSYVRKHHSLQFLISRILTFINQPPFDPKTFYDCVMPDKYGSDYESARWRTNPLLSAQYQMMVDAMSRFVLPNALQAARILEVGPGPGTWTRFLLEENPGAQYTLVDISSEMLAQAKKNLANRANVVFVENDLLEFESSQPFNFFFSSRAIEYMPDKSAVIKKISASLAQGAQGAIITKTPKPFFDWMRGRASRTLHSAQINPATLAHLLRTNGLVVEKIRIATATVPLIGSVAINEFAYRLLRHFPLFFPFTLFSESYLITFRKPV